MFIEFTGPVGAGKSTISAALEDLLLQYGIKALPVSEVIRCCLGRSWLNTIASRVAQRMVVERMSLTLYYRVLDHYYSVYFACANPALTWHVLKSQFKPPIPVSHRIEIWRRVFHVGGRYYFLRARLHDGELVIADEGLVHRAVELFGWTQGPVSPALVTDYLELLPSSVHLIVVTSPAHISLARATARGLPKSFLGKDGETIDRFMRNSADILGVTQQFWSTSNRRVLELDNGGALGHMEDDLTEGLRAWGLLPGPQFSVAKQRSCTGDRAGGIRE